ncbi:MAG: 3-methylitaconate isomerase [Acidobacteria bacterium]|nr:3-methylitaconate isomerase [Acidobacteriota bacterium]
MTTPQQIPIPYVLMRGGTSKAVFLHAADLPQDPAARDRMILAVFGSPDPRQIDGLGGADLLTSKLAIIGPPSRDGADLDYTFGQVSVSEPAVDYDINCGNISAAVGAYAVDEGLVGVTGPEAVVRVHNTNTGRVFVAHVPVTGGEAAIEGDLTVEGVPGTGAPILLDYAEAAGGATGALLPTGRAVDLVRVAGKPVEVSLVDIGNLSVFFSAEAFSMTGTEGPSDMTREQFDRIASLKDAAAALAGVGGGGLTPVPVAVGSPASYTCFGTGERVAADTIDLVARVIGGRPPVVHKAYPGTVGVCTAIAAAIPGTVVARTSTWAGECPLTIGHPSGRMPVWGRVRADGDGWVIEQAAYARTARRIADGSVFVRTTIRT